MMTTEESLKRSGYIIYLIDEEKKKSTFAGLFRSYKDAKDFRNRFHKGKYSLTRPMDLPERKNDYFQKFMLCRECDINPNELRKEKDVVLVQIKHGEEWHFMAVLPDREMAGKYLYGMGNVYRTVDLRFPKNKNTFFDTVMQKLGKDYVKLVEDKRQVISKPHGPKWHGYGIVLIILLQLYMMFK